MPQPCATNESGWTKSAIMAGTQGFEPRLDGPEPPVLPLNDVPAMVARSIISKGERAEQRRRAVPPQWCPHIELSWNFWSAVICARP